MNCCAHIFIGKEFEQLVQDIGRASYRYGGSAVSCMHYYLLDLEQSAPGLQKLSISSSAPSAELEGMDNYFDVKWTDNETGGTDLTGIYRSNIFNDILGGVNRGSHNCLYVCIHFPFYKETAFRHLETLYKAIKDARMPNKLSFIGYCSDVAEMISPQEKDVGKLSGKKQASAYARFKEKNNILNSEHLVLFQNAFQNGMPLNLTGKSLADTLSLLLLQYVNHYDELYPDTMTDSDLVSFGISAISLDKYRFIEYLFCQTMMHSMDVSSVMDDKVSVNEVFAKVRDILHGKEHVLSEFLDKHKADSKESRNILEAEKFISDEGNAIIDKCEEILHENSSMPLRTAILAALLQTRCDLFHQMIFDTDSPDLNSLFSEAIDYFIGHDKSHFYWTDEDTPPVNPLNELKTLNNRLINAESQILELQESLDTCQAELEQQQSAEKVTSFQEDGYFHIDDRRYRLLPNTEEEPLQETYVPHEVHAESLDLRGNFRGIQDQGTQGSCLAFALTSVFEYVMRTNNRCQEYDLSEAFLYYNARMLDPENTENMDSGSRFKPALDSLCRYGIAVESLCRYDENVYDRKPSEEAYDDASKRLLRKAVNVSHNVADIKSALEDGYPVAASFTLCRSFSDVSQGFVPMPADDEIAEARDSGTPQDKHSCHAMVIVGFDDKIGCFLVRNSWGAGWGDRGYCYIPYSYIENDCLFNFACILVEIESVEQSKAQVKEIPVLHLDDTDVSIRYHIALAALHTAKKNAADIRQERNALLVYLEHLKQMLSNHMDCQKYIDSTCEKTKEEQDALRKKIKAEQDEIDREYDEFSSVKKKLIYKVVGYTAGILLFVSLYNWIIHKIAHQIFLHLGKVTDFIEKIYVLVWNYFADIPIYSKLIDFKIHKIHYALIIVLVGILLYKGCKAWRIWKESKNEHERQIALCNKEISAKQKEIDSFQFNTQVAQKWMVALIKLQSAIQQRYTNIISRINNLRSWYADLSAAEKNIDLKSSVPYTTLLDKTVLDNFFENSIKNDPDFEIDYSENLDRHRNTEDYLSAYQENIRNKIITLLVNHPRLQSFNITEHIVSDAYDDIARRVALRSDNAISMENVKRQSDVFMHINPLNRGIIMPSTYVIAPYYQQQSNKIRQKVGYGFDTYLPSDNALSFVLLQIMSLEFDDCTMFQ